MHNLLKTVGLVNSENVIEYADKSSDGSFWYHVTDHGAYIDMISYKALELLGYKSLEEISERGLVVRDILKPIVYNEAQEQLYKDFLAGKVDRLEMEGVLSTKDGREIFGLVLLCKSEIYKYGNDELEICATVYVFRAGQSIFSQSKALLEEISSVIVIYRIDKDGLKLHYANKTYANLLKYSQEEIYKTYGKRLGEYVIPEDKEILMDAINEAIKTGKISRASYRVRAKDGEEVWFHSEHKLIVIGKKQFIYLLAMDISGIMDIQQEMKRNNEELQRMILKYDSVQHELEVKERKLIDLSYRDPLTNVLNRLSYNEYIINNTSKKYKNTGVAFVDLNGLKTINDTMGHQRGDDTIKLTVMLIENYFEQDEIYRISGDNFIIIKENIDAIEFYKKMNELQQELDRTDIAALGYNWDEHIFDIENAINKAEASMRIAKQEYYKKHDEDISKHRPIHLNSLLNDLRNGVYEVYLQPKSYCKDNKIVAAEALVRRVDPDGTVVAPDKFIHTLEEEKLINHLDFYVLEKACIILKEMNKKYDNEDFVISVNMSKLTLIVPDYINKVLTIVDRQNIKHSQIELEITETQASLDKNFLSFKISLDDMGSDYSSVKMLIMNGIDTVKIDKSLISQMKTDEGLKLIKLIISMCHEFDRLVIAEGVEDDETRLKLYEMGCDMYQGYLLSPPVNVREFEKLLELN